MIRMTVMPASTSKVTVSGQVLFKYLMQKELDKPITSGPLPGTTTIKWASWGQNQQVSRHPPVTTTFLSTTKPGGGPFHEQGLTSLG